MPTIEQIIEELVWDLTAVAPRPKSDVRRRLKDLYEAGRNDRVPSEGEVPMGVSQWREHGKKYGYWDAFRSSVIEECVGALPKGIPHEVNGFPIGRCVMVVDVRAALRTVKQGSQKPRTRLNSLKEKTQ